MVDERVQLSNQADHAELHCGSAAGGQQRLGAFVFAALDQCPRPPVAGAGGQRRRSHPVFFEGERCREQAVCDGREQLSRHMLP